MTYVTAKPGESAESLLRRFRKQVSKDRIMGEVKKRRYFITKGEKRRIEERKGIRNARKRERKARRRDR
ncbi:MAG: 30S ribosomal protein S21 [Anaerolineae bacterium]